MKYLTVSIFSGIVSTATVLIFQHFMVIKPLMDMLDSCQLLK